MSIIKTPLELSMVMPSSWGAKVDTTRVWADDRSYKPTVTIAHYFGGANVAGTAPYSVESERSMLRQAEAWHMNPARYGGPMRAIAYNFGIGQTGHIYYLRGPMHNNGGQWQPWNSQSKTVVFILGGDQVPSMAARVAFGRLWLEEPLEKGQVWGHRDVGDTQCPGEWIYAWVVKGGFVDDLGVWSEGDVSPVISSIKVRLHRAGWRLRVWGSGPKFGSLMRRQVQRFQKRHGIRPDGVVGPVTLRAMAGLMGEVFPDDHTQEPTG